MQLAVRGVSHSSIALQEFLFRFLYFCLPEDDLDLDKQVEEERR